MRTKRIAVVCMAGLLSWGAQGLAWGATQEQIDAAVQSGLAWLVSQQQPNGSWIGTRNPGTTALCLTVLGHHAQESNTTPLAAGYVHSARYAAGVSNMLDLAFHDTVNERVWFGNANIAFSENYILGPAIMALVLSGEPNHVVNVPGSPVHGLTHKMVVQRIVNTISFNQITSGNAVGSWDYRPQNTAGDLSLSGWITLGLGYARDRFEIELPATMMNRIRAGIDIMQQTANPASPDFGGAGYRSTSSPAYAQWVNVHKAGHLLYMMKLVGDPPEGVRVQRALDYLVRHWNSASSGTVGTPGWRGNPPSVLPSYIGTVTIMKGLVAYELEEIGTDIDWFDDVSTVIVNNQNATGFWQQDGYPPGASHRVAATAFALLTLLKATPLAPVDASFENISYTTADYLVTSGLGGTGYYIIVARDAAAPTEEQIKAGVDYGAVTVVASGSGPITEDVEATYALSGLQAGTSYDLYFVVQAPDQSFGLLVKNSFQTQPYTVPTVDETTPASGVTPGSASSGGHVNDSGGLPVTQRGVVWSTSPAPTLDSHPGGGVTLDGDGIGGFTSLLSGLLPDTLYYVRAYAVNAIGEGHGPAVTFRTEPRLIQLLGLTTLQYGWYARVSEYQLRCRFVFDEPLQPAGGPLQMRRLWLDTPDQNTYEIYHYTNQTVFGTNVLFQLVSLTGYGDDIPSDGEYTLHLEYADQSVTQTVFQFFVPGTTNPLPTPTQFPTIDLPIQGSTHTGTVEFAWSPVTDTNVSFVTLQSASQFWVLPPDVTDFGPVELPLGDQSLEVWFMHGYDALYTDEGVPYQIGKGNSKVHTFEMVNDSEWILFYSASMGGTLSGDTAQVVPFGANGTPVEAHPQLDAVFAGWSDGLTGNLRAELYVTNDISVTASFNSPAGVPLTWYEENGLLPGPGETWADVDADDEDGDDASNADEYFADTNPNNPDKVLRIERFVQFPEVVLEFQSSTGRLYRIRTTYDIRSGAWYDLPGELPRPGVGGTDTLTDPHPPDYDYYYRIEAELP